MNARNKRVDYLYYTFFFSPTGLLFQHVDIASVSDIPCEIGMDMFG